MAGRLAIPHRTKPSIRPLLESRWRRKEAVGVGVWGRGWEMLDDIGFEPSRGRKDEVELPRYYVVVDVERERKEDKRKEERNEERKKEREE